MLSRSTPAVQRFWLRVERTDSCWLWRGPVNWGGYGTFRVKGKTVRVHRYAYELMVGPIPVGLHIDHLCRTRNCVNPAHLEAVTSQENGRRGISAALSAARQLAKTHCPAGHLYDEANTYRNPRGRRFCRTCKRTRDTQWRLKKPQLLPKSK